MNIAHYFTFIRIFISPIFLLVYLKYTYLGIPYVWLPYILLFLLGVSEFSDAFDGYIARKLGQVTDLGKIFDPMADSIARTSVFLTFTMPPVSLPMLLIFVFIYRDSVISTLRTVCALRGVALAARKSGKLKAIFQGISAFFILILMVLHSLDKLSLHRFQTMSFYAVFIVAIYATISGVEYIYANKEYVKKVLQLGKSSLG